MQARSCLPSPLIIAMNSSLRAGSRVYLPTCLQLRHLFWVLIAYLANTAYESHVSRRALPTAESARIAFPLIFRRQFTPTLAPHSF